MSLKYLPQLFQYKDNHFINLELIEAIEPAEDGQNMRYWVNGHIYCVPIEAHNRLMEIYKAIIENEEK